MILEFSIENTYSIKEKQTISFEASKSDVVDEKHTIATMCDDRRLLKFACIYGANGAGKTNLLEAFDFYVDFIVNSFIQKRPGDRTGFIPFEFCENAKTSCGAFNVVFYAPLFSDESKNVKYIYDLCLTRDCVVAESLRYSPKGQSKLIFARTENSIHWGSDVSGPKKVIEKMVRSNCSLLGVGAQTNQVILSFIYTHFAKRVKGSSSRISSSINEYFKLVDENADYKKKVLGLLNSFDFGSVSEIKVDSRKYPPEVLEMLPQEVKDELKNGRAEEPLLRLARFIHSYNGVDYPLSFSWESSGTKKVFELTQLLIFASDSSVLIVDELERSLHPDIVEAFLKLVLEISGDSQLLFVTHNQDLLDSDLLRDDEVWFCYKTDKGNSIYRSIISYTGIRKEASRKKLYKSGKFGSLPSIDYESLRSLFQNTLA